MKEKFAVYLDVRKVDHKCNILTPPKNVDFRLVHICQNFFKKYLNISDLMVGGWPVGAV